MKLEKYLVMVAVFVLAACSEREETAVRGVESVEVDEDTRPNILFILADDLGFTDIGAFGGEIPTPNLDALAYEGVRLASLHAGPACQATRSMVMGSVPESRGIIARPRLPGGERDNLLSLEWATIPELLKEAGYATYMAGKWDLGWDEGYTPATRGFDRSYAMLSGSSSFFAEPLLLTGGITGFEEDGRTLSFSDFPEDFYVTDTYTDKMLGYLESSPDGQPWFAYLPYTAPHWPLQLPDEWIDRHAGNYDDGYDTLRAARVDKATEVGVIQENFSLEGFQTATVSWQELSEESKMHYARTQEIYAGMVEHMDMNIGRVIAHLRETGQLENTLIIFASDHGGSGAEYGSPASRLSGSSGNAVEIPSKIDNSLENIGRINSFVDHGVGFAEAATAPYLSKKGSMHEGGLRAAAFVYYPEKIQGGQVSHSFMTMMDLLPTLMDASDTEMPIGNFKGREIQDPYGVSAWPYLIGETATVHTETAAGWSSHRGAALIQGQYKIIREPLSSDWELFNIVQDPGERSDLAAAHPEIVETMEIEWETNWK